MNCGGWPGEMAAAARLARLPAQAQPGKRRRIQGWSMDSRLEEELLTCVARADGAAVDLVGRLDPELVSNPVAQHLLKRIVAEAAEHRSTRLGPY